MPSRTSLLVACTWFITVYHTTYNAIGQRSMINISKSYFIVLHGKQNKAMRIDGKERLQCQLSSVFSFVTLLVTLLVCELPSW
jgi:hypothetical protein